jgi:maltose alpha-D-glucosyltransferase/alpha-amylase
MLIHSENRNVRRPLLLLAILWGLLTSVALAQDVQLREKRASTPLSDLQFTSDAHYIAWLERHSMLHEATRLSSKLPAAALSWRRAYAEPQPREAVKAASVWVLGYAGSVIPRPGESVIATWADPDLWKTFQEIGIDLLHTGPVNQAGGIQGYQPTQTVDGWFDPISLTVDPQLGTDDEYQRMVRVASRHGGMIAGDLVPLHTGKGADFRLAERGYRDYPRMYVMAEIREADWGLLPPVDNVWRSVPISREAARKLTEKGYLPGQIHSNDATPDALELSGWDATAEIIGADGKTRRWAYLHFFKPGQPTLNWLDPTAAAQRTVAGNLVKMIHTQGAKVVRLDAVPFLGIEPGKETELTWHYQHPLSLWGTHYLSFLTRRLGGWTFQELNVPLEQLRPFAENGPDLSYDFFTRTQLVHSLLTGDASLLRQAYQWLQESDVPLVSLVHDLQNHDEITYQLVEFNHRADERFTLHNKPQTGREIREEILATMRREAAGAKAPYNLLYRPQKDGLATTFAGFIAASLGIRDPYHATPEQVDQIKRAHLLLTMASAMQPGVFSLSSWDLVGALPLPAQSVAPLLEDHDYRWINRGAVDLLGVNPRAERSAWGLPRAQSLYGSLPDQLKDPQSFASQLKRILAARKRSGIALGQLIAIPAVKHPGLCVLVFKLENGSYAITALNFARDSVRESLDLSVLRSAVDKSKPEIPLVDALTGTVDGKLSPEQRAELTLDPLSAKTWLLGEQPGQVGAGAVDLGGDLGVGDEDRDAAGHRVYEDLSRALVVDLPEGSQQGLEVQRPPAGHLLKLLVLRKLLHAAFAPFPGIEVDQLRPQVLNQPPEELRVLRQMVGSQGDAQIGRAGELGEVPLDGLFRVGRREVLDRLAAGDEDLRAELAQTTVLSGPRRTQLTGQPPLEKSD